ncbi:hypothetical protein JCM6882_003065 [Rhodosporidiobolus microsporus]
MPRAYDDVPPSPSTASSSSRDFDSDSDDGREKSSFTRRPAAQGKRGSSPVVWVVVGMVVMLVAGLVVYFVVRGLPGSSEEASSSAADNSPATTSKASASAGGTLPSSSSVASSDEDEDEDEGGIKPSRASGNGDEEQSPSSPTDASASSPSSTNTPASSSSSSGTSSLPPLAGTSLLVDFSTYSGSSSSDLDSFLSSHGLMISTYGSLFIGPIGHAFTRETVDYADGALRLKVVGQSSGTDEVQGAEVATVEDVLYGVVTTRAKASPVAGVCHGFFFYNDVGHEVDIELLSSFYTEGKGDSVQPGAHFTNHPITDDGEPYTIEWKEGETIFSLDGKAVKSFKENIPSDAMAMIWNSWSSGEPNWSAGPPTEDSYLLISGIAANWTTAGGGGAGGEDKK